MRIDNNSELRSRVFNMTGSEVARNTSFALIDEDTGNVSSSERYRKQKILGLVPTNINSPRIKLINSNEFKVLATEEVANELNEFWPLDLTTTNVRKLIVLIDRKLTTRNNRPKLLRVVQSEFSSEVTADILSRTIGILRGKGLLETESYSVMGTAVLNRSTAVLNKFVLGDGYKKVELPKTRELPGVSPIQAYHILQKDKIKDHVRDVQRLR